jgi:methylmalonyl-CoA mutase C-terminal domain/subunit
MSREENSMPAEHVRVVLAKPTHDCHDRGVRHLARALRDDGFEVIFINFLLPQEVINVALHEDADVVGISSSSGGHLAVFEDLMDGLAGVGLDDVLVLAGGVIPPNDARAIMARGVSAVFGPGSSAQQVAGHIRARLGDRSSVPA